MSTRNKEIAGFWVYMWAVGWRGRQPKTFEYLFLRVRGARNISNRSIFAFESNAPPKFTFCNTEFFSGFYLDVYLKHASRPLEHTSTRIPAIANLTVYAPRLHEQPQASAKFMKFDPLLQRTVAIAAATASSCFLCLLSLNKSKFVNESELHVNGREMWGKAYTRRWSDSRRLDCANATVLRVYCCEWLGSDSFAAQTATDNPYQAGALPRGSPLTKTIVLAAPSAYNLLLKTLAESAENALN